MNVLRFLLLGLVLLIQIGCSADGNPTELKVSKKLNHRFTEDTQGWQGGFADYPNGEEDFYELDFSHATLPAPLDQKDGAIMQKGNNHSDDLFMFIKRHISGLTPNSNYKVNFDIEFATDAADGSVGVGGSPAESVVLKVGAVLEEPESIPDQDNFLLMNLDKGNQSVGGDDMIVLGDMSNGSSEFVYKLKRLTNNRPIEIESNAQGNLWLIIGTDSGFEGTTTIYYNKISVNIEM